MKLVKVTTYITCDEKLLVFRHVDHPEAGIQVPAGTAEPEEDLERAALREAEEESGLSDFVVNRYLGKTNYIFEPAAGSTMEIERHYYHLVWPGPIRESTWRHWELTPSVGHEDRLLFELFWVDIKDVPQMPGKLSEKLHLI